jgi:hypothetical protein
VEEDLAEAAKNKAETENCNANVMGQLVGNILGQMQPCLVKEKDQGTISAIEDVKSFLAKKVDDAKETLTQGQQNLARELKTPFY